MTLIQAAGHANRWAHSAVRQSHKKWLTFYVEEMNRAHDEIAALNAEISRLKNYIIDQEQKAATIKVGHEKMMKLYKDLQYEHYRATIERRVA